MRAVIQRVQRASVTIDDRTHGAISQGMVVLLGIGASDTQKDLHWLVEKIMY